MENLRPIGGMLRKLSGCNVHSSLIWKAASVPRSLIAFYGAGTSTIFVATAWDSIFVYSAGNWVNLCTGRADGGFDPGNYPFGGYRQATLNAYYTNVNWQYDYLIYNDILYITDGYNRPMKTDGSSIGQWGLKSFTGANVLANTPSDAVGSLPSGATFLYKSALYDSVREVLGELETNAMSVAIGGANKDIFVYFDAITDLIAQDNYDWKDNLATKWNIYRNPDVNGGDAVYTLHKTLNVVTDVGTITTGFGVAPNNIIVDAAANFDSDVIKVGYCVWLDTDGLGWVPFQITNVTAQELTVISADGTAVAGGEAASIDQAYRVVPGFIDSTADISGNDIHPSDDTTLTPELRDHATPPNGKYCCFGYGRAFIAGDPDNPNRIYYSQEADPVDPTNGSMEYFPLENTLDIDPDDGDKITAILFYNKKLFVFKRMSCAVVDVRGAPIEWVTNKQFLSVGTEDKRLVADCGGVLIFANYSGVYALAGSRLSHISHENPNANIIETWGNQESGDYGVRLNELYQAQGVYNRKRKEYWLSVTMNDERGEYDSSLTGQGDIQIATGDANKVAEDNPDPSQNNMTLIYSLRTGQWFTSEHIRAASWAVFKGEEDILQLYRGWYEALVLQEDTGESVDSQDGDRGQATAGAADGLTDGSKAWTADEWIGGTVYLHRTDGTTENQTITDNDATEVNVDSWTGANPAQYDYYILTKPSLNAVMSMRWRTPKLFFDSLTSIKQYIELIMKMFGTGSVTFSYDIDGDVGGTMTLNLDQPDYTWGEEGVYWSSDGAGGHWNASGDTANIEELFPATEDGYSVEFEITHSTIKRFEITQFTVRYKANRGRGWAP
jgi:hypothetical protein